MTDPSFTLRAGQDGPVVEGTPGNVLTIQADGKTVAGEPVAPPSGASRVVMWFGSEPGVAGSGDFLRPFQPLGVAAANELLEATLKIPQPGSLTRITAGLVGGGTVADAAATFTARVNQVDTSLTCTIAEGDGSGAGSGSVAVVENDDIAIILSSSGSPNVQRTCWVCLTLEPS